MALSGSGNAQPDSGAQVQGTKHSEPGGVAIRGYFLPIASVWCEPIASNLDRL